MKRLYAFRGACACLFAASALQVSAWQAPAQPQQEPIDSHTTIRSETRLVLVDSVVTDKKGNYVHDLTQKDFKVYEDNKEQAVTSFSFESNASPDQSRKHYLVLFFDNSTVQASQQSYARDAAIKFIDKNAGPNRLMAIAEFGGALQVTQNFTDDVDRLKKVVNGIKFSAVGSASGGIGGRQFTNFSTRGVLGALRDMAKGLADVPGRKTLIFLSGGFPMTQEILTEVTATIDSCNRANVAIYPIDVRGLVAPAFGPVGSLMGFGSLAQMAMLNASSLVGPVAFLQGRGGTGGAASGGGSAGGTNSGGGKTPGTGTGVSTGSAGGSRPVTSPTNPGTNPGGGRSGTTNPNTGGGGQNNQNNQLNQLNQANINARMRSILPPVNNSITGNQQALYALADGTGGFVIVNTNDLLGGLEKIGREQNEYYILGYTPSKESEPGACHTLHVKVDKGASVRARTGYCEAKTADVLSGTPAERDLEARISGNVQTTVPAASMRAPFFYISANTARVDVALDLPAGTLKFAKDKGKFRSVMNVVGIAYLPDGSVGARFSDSVRTTLDDQKEVAELEAKPYHYEKQFEAAPGKYNLKVVFSSSADQFGKLETPLAIEPWETTQFALSGLVLSKREVHPAQRNAVGGLDSRSCWRTVCR